MTRNECQLQNRGVLTPIFSYFKENIVILKSVQRKSNKKFREGFLLIRKFYRLSFLCIIKLLF